MELKGMSWNDKEDHKLISKDKLYSDITCSTACTVPVHVGSECPPSLQKVLSNSHLMDIQPDSGGDAVAGQISLDRSRDTPAPLLATPTDRSKYTAQAGAQNGAEFYH